MNECMEDSYLCQGSQRSCISSSCSVKLTLDSIWEAHESRSVRHQAEFDANLEVVFRRDSTYVSCQCANGSLLQQKVRLPRDCTLPGFGLVVKPRSWPHLAKPHLAKTAFGQFGCFNVLAKFSVVVVVLGCSWVLLVVSCCFLLFPLVSCAC